MTDLLADLAALGPGRGGVTCHTAFALSKLPEQHRGAVLEAMDNPLMSSSDLARLLNKHTDSTLSATQMARHRRRGAANGCKCPRGDGGAA